MTRNTLNCSAKLRDKEGTKEVTSWSSEDEAVGTRRAYGTNAAGKMCGLYRWPPAPPDRNILPTQHLDDVMSADRPGSVGSTSRPTISWNVAALTQTAIDMGSDCS